MDGQYPQAHVTSLVTFYPSGHPPIMPPPPPGMVPSRLDHLPTWSTENLHKFAGYEDPSRGMIASQQPTSRSRRRQASGSEHVKHRRTRSGCYTCRQRRVKCDETHPTCERCRKGKRECVYPGNSSRSSESRKSKGETQNGISSKSDEDDDEDEQMGLDSIVDEGESDVSEEEKNHPSLPITDRNVSPQALHTSNESQTSPTTVNPAISDQPPAKTQSARLGTRASIKDDITSNSKWRSLHKEVKMYLTFHRDQLSYHHYALKYDGTNFLKTVFLEIALNDESGALLYAIVAFAAYHHMIQRGDSRISHFLNYYNRSIMLLQASLRSKRPNVTTLLTILQLATIEEFLGDWVNLLGHQRAAHQILTDLFTPQTITQDDIRRKIINWYIRFDLFAGLMSGGETHLGREWFSSCQEYYSKLARERPDDIGAKFEDFLATSRLMATDVTLVLASKTKESISDEEFVSKTTELTEKYAEFGRAIDTAYTDPALYVKTFPKSPPPGEERMTDYDDPHFCLADKLFTMNFIRLDFWAIDMMFKYQLSVAQGKLPPAELGAIAMKKVKMFEAIEYSDQGPPGVLLGGQASLGITSVFLPKDSKHINWCRRKFALMEQKGYIYQSTLRKRMSEVWGVDVSHWWLPNEEGYPQTIRAVRDFIEYRATIPPDAMGEHVRNMDGVFRSLNLNSPTTIDKFEMADRESSTEQSEEA